MASDQVREREEPGSEVSETATAQSPRARHSDFVQAPRFFAVQAIECTIIARSGTLDCREYLLRESHFHHIGCVRRRSEPYILYFPQRSISSAPGTTTPPPNDNRGQRQTCGKVEEHVEAPASLEARRGGQHYSEDRKTHRDQMP